MPGRLGDIGLGGGLTVSLKRRRKERNDCLVGRLNLRADDVDIRVLQVSIQQRSC
jgi:hypothetical protein